MGGGGFQVIIYGEGENLKMEGPNFMLGVDPSRHHVLVDYTLLSFKIQ